MRTLIIAVVRACHAVWARGWGLLWTALVRFETGEWHTRLKVNHFSRVSAEVTFGDNVHFNGMKISGPGAVHLGSNFHSGRDCLIISGSHNYEGTALPYDVTYVSRDIRIEDNVWLGDRVIVLGGAVIEEGAIIQAGSVVVGRIPRCAIAGGHPARAFKTRDVDRYERLKAAGLFH